MQLTRRRRNNIIVFILLQFGLYCSFLALDLLDGSIILSSIIKFSIVIFCFWYALLFGKSIYQKQLLYLRIALLFTVIADLLILIYDYYFLGVLAFCVVQQLYALRLDMRLCNDNRDRNICVSLVKRMILQLIITLIISILLNFVGVVLEILLVITVFYFTSIMMNVWNAIRLALKKHNRINTLFAFGITLFLLCDINVGIFNLSNYISLSSEWFYTIYLMSTILMWAFYAPSQVFIALCAYDHN